MRGPTYAFPITRGEVPNVLSSRMRTAWPEMVTLAIIRTVVFDATSMPSPLCEVSHAVIHRSDEGAGCCAGVAESTSNARPATNPILDRADAVVMRPSLPPDRPDNLQRPVPKSCWRLEVGNWEFSCPIISPGKRTQRCRPG